MITAVRFLVLSSILSAVLAEVATIDEGGNIGMTSNPGEFSLGEPVDDKVINTSNTSQVVVTDATAEVEEFDDDDDEEYEEEEEWDDDEEEVGLGSEIGDVQIYDVEEQKLYLEANFVEMEPLDPEAILKHVHETEDYIMDIVDQDESYLEVRGLCQNYDPMCTVWALAGDCENAEEQAYMIEYCGAACKMCEKIDPKTHFLVLEELAAEEEDVIGEETPSEEEGKIEEEEGRIENELSPTDEENMAQSDERDEEEEFENEEVGLGSDFGHVQISDMKEQQYYFRANRVEMESLEPEAIKKHVAETEIYLRDIVYKEDSYLPVRELCQNFDPMCTVWALSGDCENADEQAYLVDHCGPACKMCDKINPDTHKVLTRMVKLSALDEKLVELYGDDNEEENEEEDEDIDEEDGLGAELGVVQVYEIEEQKIYFEADNVEMEPIDPEAIRRLVAETRTYLMNIVDTEESYAEVRGYCQNYDPMCTVWALAGDCEKPEKQSYAIDYCGAACKMCDKIDPVTHFLNDLLEEEETVEEQEETVKGEELTSQVEEVADMEEEEEEEGPGSEFGDIQVYDIEEQKLYLAANFVVMEPLNPEAILKHVAETETYIKEIVQKDADYSEVRDMCKNYDPMCTVWALSGDCDLAIEQSYLVEFCGPACKMCDKINPAEHFSNFEAEEEDEDVVGEEEELLPVEIEAVVA